MKRAGASRTSTDTSHQLTSASTMCQHGTSHDGGHNSRTATVVTTTPPRTQHLDESHSPLSPPFPPPPFQAFIPAVSQMRRGKSKKRPKKPPVKKQGLIGMILAPEAGSAAEMTYMMLTVCTSGGGGGGERGLACP